MSGHVARRARMDALMSTSAQTTPRSTSWSRTKTPGSVTERTTIRKPLDCESKICPFGNSRFEFSANYRENRSMRYWQSSIHTSMGTQSVSRVKPRDDTKEKEQQEAARAAFEEWLKRKCKEPRGPRASPSREQISKHLKDDLKYRIYNTWHNNPKFQKRPTSETNGATTP